MNDTPPSFAKKVRTKNQDENFLLTAEEMQAAKHNCKRLRDLFDKAWEKHKRTKDKPTE